MKDWNVVVTVYDERGYRKAKSTLKSFGKVARTDFFNVLVLKVPDPASFAEAFDKMLPVMPGILNDISRIVPAHANFNFESPQEFEEKAKEVVLNWIDKLLGCSFYVRLHRRGFKGKIRSPDEERFLDEEILTKLELLGRPGRINFDDPDKVIVIETVGNRAGMSIWSRENLRRFDFLHID